NRAQGLQPAEIAVQHEHLCAVSALRVLPPRLGADFEQALDSLLEARPLASQQRERDAPRADVVLVDAEAGHPQKSATVKQSLEAVGVAGVQQIQLVPTV